VSGIDKPDGKFRCQACGSEWNGRSLYLDPNSTAVRWTCGDLFCGGAVTKIETAVPDFTARIDGDDERAAAWRAVFGDDTIPLRSPVPHMASLPGRGEELVYLLDIEALTADQRGRLVQHIASRFNYPAEEVDATLDDHGCPILAEHVTVTIANPWRWL